MTTRVGIVTATFPYGPAEAFLHDELSALTDLGCELTVFPARRRWDRNAHQDLSMDVVRFQLLAPKTLFQAFRAFRRNARAAARALGLIVRSKNGLKTKLKNLILFPTGLAVADEVSSRCLDHIHAYWLSGPSTVGLIASKVSGVSWSYSAHSWDVFMEDNLVREKTASANFGRVVSELGRQGILARTNDASGRVKVIHLGVRSSPARMEQHASVGTIRLLCPAFLIPVKGHTYLLQALRYVVDAGIDCRCVFAGEGPLRSKLARIIKNLHLENVVSMPGIIPHQILLEQLHSGAYNAVVLASVERGTEFEGIPVSLMEAMAAGIPCIATRTGAVPELIDARSGILVNQRDERELCAAIIGLASDPNRRREMGQNAMRRIAQEFDAKTSARSLLKLIENADE